VWLWTSNKCVKFRKNSERLLRKWQKTLDDTFFSAHCIVLPLTSSYLITLKPVRYCCMFGSFVSSNSIWSLLVLVFFSAFDFITWSEAQSAGGHPFTWCTAIMFLKHDFRVTETLHRGWQRRHQNRVHNFAKYWSIFKIYLLLRFSSISIPTPFSLFLAAE